MNDRLNNTFAKSLCAFDQQLQEVRSLYLDLTNEEKADFRNWLSALAKASNGGVAWLPMRVMIHTDVVFHGSEGDIGYEGSARLTPKAMLHAVEAWDCGEEFTPKNAFL